MSIFELATNQLFQECRRACYHALATHGYDNPDLYLERKNENRYMSYWGSGNKRMEVFYDLNADCVSIYELKFVS